MLPRIGILGGMGPAATILLQQRILEMTKVETDGDHLPLLIDMNTQVPSRINYIINGQGESPGPVLARMAQGLESHGADVIVMPCCTAHHFAADIVESVSIPFLNMVQLAIAEVAQLVPGGSSIGILASPATQKIELFKKELQSQGLKERFPKDTGAMLSAIKTIKKSGPCPMVIEHVQTAIAELEKSQAKAIIVGCSEFSLISNELSSTIPLVDAVSVLTQSITRFKKPASERKSHSA